MIKGEIRLTKASRSKLGKFKFIATNINKKTFPVSEKYAKDLAERMRRKVLKFSWSKRLYESIKVDADQTGVDRHKIEVYVDTRIAPHATFNEYGVEPHYVKVTPTFNGDKYPGKRYAYTLAGWARQKLDLTNNDLDKIKFLYIGGKMSNIKRGNSENQFFRNSIKEMSRTNTRAQYIKAIRVAIKETLK